MAEQATLLRPPLLTNNTHTHSSSSPQVQLKWNANSKLCNARSASLWGAHVILAIMRASFDSLKPCTRFQLQLGASGRKHYLNIVWRRAWNEPISEMLSPSWTQITESTHTLEWSVLLHVACKIHICNDLRQVHKSSVCVCVRGCLSVRKVECLAKRLIMYSLKWQMPTRTAFSSSSSSPSPAVPPPPIPAAVLILYELCWP